ncbi:MAG: hypothetical protein R2711_06595 [Acidimicrobiales bacterium]
MGLELIAARPPRRAGGDRRPRWCWSAPRTATRRRGRADGGGHPGARHVVVPDAAHSPQFEHPEAWWAAVHEFLAAEVPVVD